MGTKKNPQLAVWGRKGGKRRTAAKRAAARTTIKHAREHLLSKRICKQCRKNKLGWRNRSGICRVCQRGT